jgi:hypothetical protein
MAKFKEGDKVEVIYIEKEYPHLEYLVGKTGVISHVYSFGSYPYEIKEAFPSFRFLDKNLRLVSDNCHKNPMKITNIARGLLDEDYKRMIKVGWLNADLSLTDTGKDTVLSRYLMKNKETFGEMATELLDENKEDCK